MEIAPSCLGFKKRSSLALRTFRHIHGAVRAGEDLLDRIAGLAWRDAPSGANANIACRHGDLLFGYPAGEGLRFGAGDFGVGFE